MVGEAEYIENSVEEEAYGEGEGARRRKALIAIEGLVWSCRGAVGELLRRGRSALVYSASTVGSNAAGRGFLYIARATLINRLERPDSSLHPQLPLSMDPELDSFPGPLMVSCPLAWPS